MASLRPWLKISLDMHFGFDFDFTYKVHDIQLKSLHDWCEKNLPFLSFRSGRGLDLTYLLTIA